LSSKLVLEGLARRASRRAREDRGQDLRAQGRVFDAMRTQVGIRPGMCRRSPAAIRDHPFGASFQGVHR
jgi:hypothetical protein